MAKQHHSPPCTPEAVSRILRSPAFSACPQAQATGEDTLEALVLYLNLLAKWNRVMNLVGPSSWEQVLSTLVIDSFHLAACIARLPLPPAHTGEMLTQDLGAGAGLPGLPLRMLWQKGRYTLVEAREKRALFLSTYLAAKTLPGVSVFHGRAEQFMAQNPPPLLTLSRAFMPWQKVLQLIEPHSEPGAFCLFLTLEEKAHPLPPGWRALATHAYTVGAATRYIWSLQKLSPTENV